MISSHFGPFIFWYAIPIALNIKLSLAPGLGPVNARLIGLSNLTAVSYQRGLLLFPLAAVTFQSEIRRC